MTGTGLPVLKPETQIDCEPRLQLAAPLSRVESCDAVPDFSEGENAQIQNRLVSVVDPAEDIGVWFRIDELGDYIAIQQKAAHS